MKLLLLICAVCIIVAHFEQPNPVKVFDQGVIKPEPKANYVYDDPDNDPQPTVEQL
jgi:hypothetical protein